MSKPIPLERGKYYHIYNRGNNRENIFIEERNYAHFLKLYAHHIYPIADTFAYCLMLNHFHLLVRIKTEEETQRVSQTLRVSSVSQAFSNLFNAYTKSINAAYGRTGSLFEHPFDRLEVTSEAYLARLVIYITRTRTSTALSPISASGLTRRITRSCPANPLDCCETMSWHGSATGTSSPPRIASESPSRR